MRLLLIAVLALSLFACGTAPVKPLPRAKPAESMVACPDPVMLPDNATGRDILDAHVDDMEALSICRQRHQSLVQWINGAK